MTGSAQHPFCIGSTLGSGENAWAGLPQPFHWQGLRITKAGTTLVDDGPARFQPVNQ
jgi:hypothetical protein